MKNSIQVIFGKDQVEKHLLEQPLSEEEKNINVVWYHFDTKMEMDAFVKGLEAAVGWLDMYVNTEN